MVRWVPELAELPIEGCEDDGVGFRACRGVVVTGAADSLRTTRGFKSGEMRAACSAQGGR